ncbi:hypothetical protein L226DRAFT_291855 [Lentinus tigrinus ALCF2SS1-7]|uniref:uncharacterized protein n=1 Tax=Lentinus tigrinus ALCF2SS1-7 TaxID=1328758 RepID=UPI001165DEA5|nr:hypothetical protein L226DRAFT_291855 [Lentinus tigrinus ALCF2SS1-7]
MNPSATAADIYQYNRSLVIICSKSALLAVFDHVAQILFAMVLSFTFSFRMLSAYEAIHTSTQLARTTLPHSLSLSRTSSLEWLEFRSCVYRVGEGRKPRRPPRST